jgi:hypothetical protein
VREPQANTESSRGEGARDAAKQKSLPGYPPPDDESAATGIGRSVSNSVQWIKMDLEHDRLVKSRFVTSIARRW